MLFELYFASFAQFVAALRSVIPSLASSTKENLRPAPFQQRQLNDGVNPVLYILLIRHHLQRRRAASLAAAVLLEGLDVSVATLLA